VLDAIVVEVVSVVDDGAIGDVAVEVVVALPQAAVTRRAAVEMRSGRICRPG
jgi:hypothetical protein